MPNARDSAETERFGSPSSASPDPRTGAGGRESSARCSEADSGTDLLASSGRRLTALFLLSGTLAFLAWIVTHDEGLARRELSPGSIAAMFLGVFALVLPLLLHTARYWMLVHLRKPVSPVAILHIVLASTFLNHFLAAKVGNFVEPLWLSRCAGLSYWEGLQLGLVRFGHTALALLSFGSVSLAVWLALFDSQEGALLATELVALAGLLPLGALYLLPRLAAGWRSLLASPGMTGHLHRLPAPLRRGMDLLTDLLLAWSACSTLLHLTGVLVAGLELILEALSIVCFATAFGVILPHLSVLVSTLTLNLLEYLPTPPAMLGVQDWTTTWALEAGGAAIVQLPWVVLAHRLARTGVIVCGAPSLLMLISRRRDRCESS